LARFCDERKIGKIVVGVPLRLDGTPSEQTRIGRWRSLPNCGG
jgi:RNase H-fold protein (predicted Holliday junction resolvase)